MMIPCLFVHFRYGLDMSVKMLQFFAEYFDVDYKLPKQDMLALPDFPGTWFTVFIVICFELKGLHADDSLLLRSHGELGTHHLRVNTKLMTNDMMVLLGRNLIYGPHL